MIQMSQRFLFLLVTIVAVLCLNTEEFVDEFDFEATDSFLDARTGKKQGLTQNSMAKLVVGPTLTQVFHALPEHCWASACNMFQISNDQAQQFYEQTKDAAICENIDPLDYSCLTAAFSGHTCREGIIRLVFTAARQHHCFQRFNLFVNFLFPGLGCFVDSLTWDDVLDVLSRTDAWGESVHNSDDHADQANGKGPGSLEIDFDQDDLLTSLDLARNSPSEAHHGSPGTQNKEDKELQSAEEEEISQLPDATTLTLTSGDVVRQLQGTDPVYDPSLETCNEKLYNYVRTASPSSLNQVKKLLRTRGSRGNRFDEDKGRHSSIGEIDVANVDFPEMLQIKNGGPCDYLNGLQP